MVFLDSSRVLKGNKITLKVDLVKRLGVKEGDKVVFELDEKGAIIIKKG